MADQENDGHASILSRRSFIKGSGVAAAGAAFLDDTIAMAQSEAARAPNAVGPDAVPVTLRVNGAPRRLRIEPRTTLAAALRDQLDLTGTKVACDRGQCSACTVWLDGMPVVSCMTLAIEVGGREITTIEGLARGGELHPVQAAFIEHDASQCGFCTPGMVMTCAALLARNARPDTNDVREAVAGNLCRCGTYPKVFAATVAAGRRGQRERRS